MSGTTISSTNLDKRRRKILFRAWHRGTREMDLVFGRFVDARITELSDAELDDFERLMEHPDRDLFAWISGETAAPQAVKTAVYAKIVAATNSAIINK